jgi:hypothetical protein
MGIDYPERTEFCPETIVNSLNIAINFDHDLPEIIRIFEATLDKHPPKYSPDARQKCLATALLEHSNHLLPHEAHGLLRKAIEISPDREEIICHLRANFQITGISYLLDLAIELNRFVIQVATRLVLRTSGPLLWSIHV